MASRVPKTSASGLSGQGTAALTTRTHADVSPPADGDPSRPAALQQPAGRVEAQYLPFLASMRAAWAADDRPLTAHLDVTYRCDLDCQHCYLDNRTSWPELTTQEWRTVLEQLQAAGVLFLTWSGGDIVQRRDMRELLAYAASLGFTSRVKTHGGAIDHEWAAFLVQNRVGRMDVSVFSLRPELHDAITRRPGSLQNTLRGIDAARAAGLDVKVSCWVVADAIADIPLMAQHFHALGCKVTFDTRTMLDHAADPRLAALQLRGEDLQRAREAILRAQPSSRPPTLAHRGTDEPCAAGRTALYISPDGELWPCVNFPMPLGNVREASVLDVWRESPARKSLVHWDNRQRTTCQSCAGSGFCFYCPGDAYKTTGDFRNAPGHFHADARARMRAWEVVHGETFDDAAWQSVPEPGERAPRPGRTFVFPIHRPKRGGGKRVQ